MRGSLCSFCGVGHCRGCESCTLLGLTFPSEIESQCTISGQFRLVAAAAVVMIALLYPFLVMLV